MPNYDYKCLVCSHTFEQFQKMTDDVLTDCPKCGGGLKRLIGAGLSPIFKGKGFYQTDYKNVSSNVGADVTTEKSTTKIEPEIKKADKTKKPE